MLCLYIAFLLATAHGYAPNDFSSYDKNPVDAVDGLKEFLRQLAWSGLTETPAFQELYPEYSSEELQIKKIIQDEAFPNAYDATSKGNPSTPCD